MKEENPYVQIYSKDFEYEPLSETYDRFCEISADILNGFFVNLEYTNLNPRKRFDWQLVDKRYRRFREK